MTSNRRVWVGRRAVRWSSRATSATTGDDSPHASLWRNHGFLRLWLANAIDDVGTHVSALAIPLTAALTLSASAFEMGLLAAALRLPYLVLGLFAGVIVDRVPRQPLLALVNWVRAAVLAVIPITAALGMLSLDLVYLVSMVVGTCGVIFDSTYPSFLPRIVPRHQLGDANGKMETTYSAAQAGGPGLAGLIAGWAGAPVAIAVDAASFALSALLIGGIRPPAQYAFKAAPSAASVHRPTPKIVLGEIAEGLRVVRMQPILRAMTFCTGTTNLFGWVFLAVYILFMTETLGLGATTIGLILAAGGIGGVVGAIAANPIMRAFGIGPAMTWAQFIFGITGVTVPVAVLVPQYAIVMLAIAECLQFAALATFSVGHVTVRQAIVPDRLLGRVTATVRTVVGGAAFFGSLLGGVLGSWIGLGATLVLGTTGMALSCFWLIASPLSGIRTNHDLAQAGPSDYDLATDHDRTAVAETRTPNH